MVRRLVRVFGVGVGVALWLGQMAPPLVLQTRLPEEARVEQIVGREVVAKWEEVQIDARVVRMDPAAMKHATWEVRTADEKKRVAVLQMPWAIGSGAEVVDGAEAWFSVAPPLTANQESQVDPGFRKLQKAGDGEFVAAWVIDGERRSNVVKVTIDAKHQMKDEPIVRVTVAEPAVAGRLPLCAVTVVRREEKDPSPTFLDVEEASLEVDGRVMPAMIEIDPAKNPSLMVGQARSAMMPLERFGVTAEKLPKEVAAVVLGNKSAAAGVSIRTPLGDAWDGATAGLDDAVRQGGTR